METENSITNLDSAQSVQSMDSLAMNPDQKVVQVGFVYAPIALPKGINVTVVYEYAPGKIILGLGEPGYLLASTSILLNARDEERKDVGSADMVAAGSVDIMSVTGRFNEEERKDGGES